MIVDERQFCRLHPIRFGRNAVYLVKTGDEFRLSAIARMADRMNRRVDPFEGHTRVATDCHDSTRLNQSDHSQEQWPSGIPLLPGMASIGKLIRFNMRMQRKDIPKNGWLANARKYSPHDSCRSFRNDRSTCRAGQLYSAEQSAGAIEMDFVGERHAGSTPASIT